SCGPVGAPVCSAAAASSSAAPASRAGAAGASSPRGPSGASSPAAPASGASAEASTAAGAVPASAAGSSAIQNSHPGGAGGQVGSGCHPSGGRQPCGGCGQPGGVLKRYDKVPPQGRARAPRGTAVRPGLPILEASHTPAQPHGWAVLPSALALPGSGPGQDATAALSVTKECAGSSTRRPRPVVDTPSWATGATSAACPGALCAASEPALRIRACTSLTAPPRRSRSTATSSVACRLDSETST